MNAFKLIDGHAAFVLNGDTYFDVNLKRLNDFRWIKETDVVMILRYENDVSRYGAVEFDNNNQIIRFAEKSESSGEGYINGGFYLLVRSYLESFDFPEKFSIEKDFFQKYYNTERFYGLRCFSYFRDIGVPEDYEMAQDEFQRLIY
jgi:D-glycero-alpha-D-manno-heptose 1-phosphate guanylyltransferase